MSYKERLQTLEILLNPERAGGGEGDGNVEQINLEDLHELVFHGLPGDGSARPLVWRLLLNYLPTDKSTWTEHLAKKRTNYGNFVKDLLITNSGKSKVEVRVEEDHPLNPNPDSKWQQFFKDNDVLLQIDKDVRRLLPEISFFQSSTKYPCDLVMNGEIDRLHERVQFCTLESGNIVKRGIGLVTKTNSKRPSSQSHSKSQSTPETTQDLDKQPTSPQIKECHWEVVERILFIYAKLNPGQSYVQGMNEIIGPIYYVLATDSKEEWRKFAEADTFYLFTNLMGEIRDFFIRSLDNSKSGIKNMMEKLCDRIAKRDDQVAGLLSFQEIHPQYYAFRWITLLLSQEFPLPDVLRIWDSLLADKNRFDFLIDLCCAMIMHVRGELLSSDFSHNMKLLQNYPPIDVRDILALACTFLTRNKHE